MDPLALLAVGALVFFAFGRRSPPKDDAPEVSGRGEGAGAQEGARYDPAQRIGDEVVPAGEYRDGQTVEVELANPFAMFYGEPSAHTIHVPIGDGENTTAAPGLPVNWGTSGPVVGRARFTDTDTFPDTTYATYRARGQRGERYSGMVAIGDSPRWLPESPQMHRLVTATGGNGQVPGFNGAVPDGPHAPGDPQNEYGSKNRAEVTGINTRWGPMAVSSDTVNFSNWTLATHDDPGAQLRLFIGAKSWTACRLELDATGRTRATHIPLAETLRRLAWVPPGQLRAEPSSDATARANIPATAEPWTVAPYRGWAEMVRTRQAMAVRPNPADEPRGRGYFWANGHVRLDDDIKYNAMVRGAPARTHGYMPSNSFLATSYGVMPVARVDGTERVPRSLNGTYTRGPNGNSYTRFYLSRGAPGFYRGGYADGAPAVTPTGVRGTWPPVPFPLDAPVQRAALEAKGYRQHFPEV